MQRMIASPMARVLYFPGRAATAARQTTRAMGSTTRWLFGSREATNYTYDLTERNVMHLAWFVNAVTGASVDEALGYIQEIQADDELKRHIAATTASSPMRWSADKQAKFGRRVGWYAAVRALKPAHVVETGTDKGLGSLVLAAAVMRNGTGRLTTIDINPASGYLISGPYAKVTDVVISDGVEAIGKLDVPVNLFIHDSNHSSAYEKREFVALADKLAPGAVVLSDNAHASDSLLEWAGETGRRFLYFQEQPAGHWYPGASIGAALPPAK